MSEHTAIEWTDSTWNPWMGCTKVSPGCAHCYMFREQRQYGHDPELVRRSKTKFNDPLKWKEPWRVFTCSWSDWFHEGADQWRDEAWDIIRRTPHLTYQILTKRPERIDNHLPDDWDSGYPNVWLGVSVENQSFAERASILCAIPAVIRFVSAEPLLGPVDLTRAVASEDGNGWSQHHDVLHGAVFSRYTKHAPYVARVKTPRVNWVIVGGESGPGWRPMREEWVRSLRDQCVLNDTAFFLKQLGGNPDKRGHEKAVLDGERYVKMPARQLT